MRAWQTPGSVGGATGPRFFLRTAEDRAPSRQSEDQGALSGLGPMKGCPAGAGATPWLVSSLAHTAGTEECDRAKCYLRAVWNPLSTTAGLSGAFLCLCSHHSVLTLKSH